MLPDLCNGAPIHEGSAHMASFPQRPILLLGSNGMSFFRERILRTSLRPYTKCRQALDTPLGVDRSLALEFVLLCLTGHFDLMLKLGPVHPRPLHPVPAS